MKKSGSRNAFLTICIAPATILFFVFMILPTFNVFRMSLFEKGAYSPQETFVGLKNFQVLFKDANFIRSMQNMILLMVIVTLFTFVFAIEIQSHLKAEYVLLSVNQSVSPDTVFSDATTRHSVVLHVALCIWKKWSKFHSLHNIPLLHLL